MTRLERAQRAYDSAPPGRKWITWVRLRDARTAHLAKAAPSPRRTARNRRREGRA